MKRFCIALAFVGFLVTAAFARTTLSSLNGKDARSMGSGGSSKLVVQNQFNAVLGFAIPGGLNQNCLSMGAGIDILLIRVDAAIFGEDIGSADPRSGFSLRAAVKF